MKIRIEFDGHLQEEEVIIRCPSLSERVQTIQRILSENDNSQEKMLLFKNETEYYVNLDDILFLKPEYEVLRLILLIIFFRQNISYTNWKNFFPVSS